MPGQAGSSHAPATSTAITIPTCCSSIRTPGGVAIWQMNGTQVEANPQIGVMPSGSHLASIGDYNGDSKMDLLFENDQTHVLTEWLMNGTQVVQVAEVGTVNATSDWHLLG